MFLMQMAYTCKAYGVLPRPGGLLDQDSFHVHVLTTYENAVRERESRDAKRAQADAEAKSRSRGR